MCIRDRATAQPRFLHCVFQTDTLLFFVAGTSISAVSKEFIRARKNHSDVYKRQLRHHALGTGQVQKFGDACNVDPLWTRGAVAAVHAAVSYTHLDVYKRQNLFRSRLFLCAPAAFCLCAALLCACSAPVSYTHLDVYKRQLPSDIFVIVP